MDKRNSGQQQQQQGMKCPQCGGFIPCTVLDIIKVGKLTCPACGLVLTIDSSKSQKVIDALKKVATEKEAEKKDEKDN